MTQKDTKNKLPLNLIPPRSLESIALVRDFGNKKYKSSWGWLKGTTEGQFREAAKRHLLKIDMGEYVDQESGLLHIEHALCSLAMAIELIKRGK